MLRSLRSRLGFSPAIWRGAFSGAPFIIGCFAFLGCVLALGVEDRLNPPDLSRATQRSLVVTADKGEILRTFLAKDGAWRLPVSSDMVDPRFIRLLLAWEDQRFAAHPGVDPMAILRALYQMASQARVVSGASTLTMQVARLIEPRPRTLAAKAQQMVRALQLEWRFSKDEILGLYLTLAPYGGNLEGVRAASLAWFGKEPRVLSTGEAALLVALPQLPERRRPDRFPAAAKAARDRVLRVLAERGMIGAAEAAEGMAEPVPAKRVAFPFHAPHMAERLARGPAPGATVASTINAKVQIRLEDLATREGRVFEDGATLAAIVVENATQRIVGHLGGHDFWGPAGQIDLSRRPRSPGSALKPFIYGLAFDDLIVHPQTLIDDKPILFGDYAPRNFDRAFQGTVSITQALQMSLNVPAVALLDRVGPVRLAATLRNAGANLEFATKGAIPSLPLALGGVGLSLEDLTMLYASIPAQGMVTPLRVRMDEAPGASSRIFGPIPAHYLAQILRGSPLPDGWSMGRGVVRERTIAFKTGTSYGFRDAWAMGFSPRYTVGIWVGRPDGSTRPGFFGRNAAAPILLKVFELLPQEPPGALPAPPGAVFAQNAEQLPRGLQKFRARRTDLAGMRAVQPPRISFPPDGSVLSVAADTKASSLAFKASGGEGRLQWIVNGLPLAEGVGEQIYWTPEGEGFVQVTVVDAAGRSDTARVRLKAER
jgi:penicillin-binding protein 1C